LLLCPSADLPERPIHGLSNNLSQRDPRFAQNSQLDQFSDDARRQPLIDGSSIQRNASANSLSRLNQPIVVTVGDRHPAFDRQFVPRPSNGLDEDSRLFQNGRLAPANDDNNFRPNQFQAVDRPFQSTTVVSQNFVVGPSIDVKSQMLPSLPSFGVVGGGPHNTHVTQSPQTPVGGKSFVKLVISK